MKTRILDIAVTATVLTILSAASADAQISIHAAAGPGQATGSAGDHRNVGYGIRAGAGLPRSERLEFRLSYEREWLPDADDPAGASSSSWKRGDLMVQGLSAEALLAVGRSTVQPYVLAGVGAYRPEVSNKPSPYGTTAGVNAGIGARYNVRPALDVFTELRGHLHATDYAAGEFRLLKYRSLHIGTRVRLTEFE